MQLRAGNTPSLGAYAVRLSDDRASLFIRKTSVAYILLRSSPWSGRVATDVLKDLFAGIPRGSDLVVTLDESLTDLTIEHPAAARGIEIFETPEDITIKIDDERHMRLFRMAIARNILDEVDTTLGKFASQFKMRLLLRMPTDDFPFFISTDLKTKRIFYTRWASRINCTSTSQKYLLLDASTNERSFESLQSVEKKVAKFLANAHTAKTDLHIADVLEKTAKFSELPKDIAQYEAVAQTVAETIAPPIVKAPSKGFAAELRARFSYPARQISLVPIDLILLCDDTLQTAFAAALVAKTGLDDRRVLEMGAFRRKLRSSFAIFSGDISVVEANFLPISMAQADTINHDMSAALTNAVAAALVVGVELVDVQSLTVIKELLQKHGPVKSITVISNGVHPIEPEMLDFINDWQIETRIIEYSFGKTGFDNSIRKTKTKRLVLSRVDQTMLKQILADDICVTEITAEKSLQSAHMRDVFKWVSEAKAALTQFFK